MSDAPTAEPGYPNAAILELAFWEAVKRCSDDETVPLSLSLRAEDDDGPGISFGNRMPDAFFEHMSDAINELRDVVVLGVINE